MPRQEIGRVLRQGHGALGAGRVPLGDTNRRRVELKLAEMAERCSELNEAVLARATNPVLRTVERFWEVAAAFEDWLAEGERRMAECGSIGTDEERLAAQAAILDVSLRGSTCTTGGKRYEPRE